MALFQVTSPSLNERWIRGNSYAIEWTGGDSGAEPLIDLMLYKGTATVSYLGTAAHTAGSKVITVNTNLATGTDYKVFASEGFIP